jgi:hypothetical protein
MVGNIGQKNQMSLKRVSRFKTNVPKITQTNSCRVYIKHTRTSLLRNFAGFM